MSKKNEDVSRRTFVKGAALTAAASTFTIVEAKSVRGTQANSMVEIGWVGNGGQGSRDAMLLESCSDFYYRNVWFWGRGSGECFSEPSCRGIKNYKL